jgi:hypothetical protein
LFFPYPNQSGGALWQAMDRRGGSGGKHVEPGESVGNASWAVFHVDDDEVVAGETGDLGEGKGEAEEEETVRFEAFGVGGGGGSDCVCRHFHPRDPSLLLLV